MFKQSELILNLPFTEMVFVEGGTFTRGVDYKLNLLYLGYSQDTYEKPSVLYPHEVTLSSFYIGKYKVTNELWEFVMGNIPSRYYKSEHCPVCNISWDHCQLFLQKLNLKTGKKFRLPTDAEWEFSAKGGNKSRGYLYAGTNCGSFYEKSTPVNLIGTNELGIFGLCHGSDSYYEWCFDIGDKNTYKNLYDKSYYQEICEKAFNPNGPTSSIISYKPPFLRIIRGGRRSTVADSSCKYQNDVDGEITIRLVHDS